MVKWRIRRGQHDWVLTTDNNSVLDAFLQWVNQEELTGRFYAIETGISELISDPYLTGVYHALGYTDFYMIPIHVMIHKID